MVPVVLVQHYFTASQKKDGMKGALREKVKSEAMNQMMNPNSMLEMMKGNMTFMVSNFVMMGLMSYFFGGFVLGASAVTAAPLHYLVPRLTQPVFDTFELQLRCRSHSRRSSR